MTAPAAAEDGRGRAVVLGVVLLVLAALAVVVVRNSAPTGEPYAIDSDAPDGLSALAALAVRRGATVTQASIGDAAASGVGVGTTVFVTAPALATATQLTALEGSAAAGATVVLGAFPDTTVPGVLATVDARSLADTPAQPQARGRCDLAGLDRLEQIDVAFGEPGPVGPDERSCFGTGGLAYVAERMVGSGRVVTLGGTDLLVNARLQPAKEDGGVPLDNAALGLAALGVPDGPAEVELRIVVVDTRPAEGLDAGGVRSPLALLPVGVQLALVQLVGALVVYAWWRTRRLGRPVRERVPVEIAGSELVVAVGDLLRRKGSPGPAAAALRADTRRRLAAGTGVAPDAPSAVLVEAVARRTGRPPAEVAAALDDGAVISTEQLVELSRVLDAIRREALHEPVRP
jgi:hypothetical protein